MSKNKIKRQHRRIARLEGALDATQGKPAKAKSTRYYEQGYTLAYQQGEVESALSAF